MNTERRTSGFTLSSAKLREIRGLVHTEITCSDDAIEEFILADWPEGQEHQDWLDSGDASEIARWVQEGLRNREFE